LAVLKKGLEVDNAHFDLLYRLPYNELNPEVTAKFESNVFSVTRQIYFSTVDQKSVDMVLFLNGLPLATLELKNPWTGQNVNHARKQYRDDRDLTRRSQRRLKSSNSRAGSYQTTTRRSLSFSSSWVCR